MIHLDVLSLREVLVGTTITVTRDGATTEHVVMPGMAEYLIARYRNHPTINVQSLNENGAPQS